MAITVVFTLGACSGATTESAPTATGDHFESENPDDSVFTDDAGNEMQVGSDLDLPAEWPAAMPVPEGRLIAVSVVDASTAVGTWQVEGDVNEAETIFVQTVSDAGFTVTPAADLSTDTITVYTAQGNDLDVTISATPGETPSDPGEITLLVNPAF